MQAMEDMVQVQGFWSDASGAVRSGRLFELSASDFREWLGDYGMDDEGYEWLEVDGVRCFG